MKNNYARKLRQFKNLVIQQEQAYVNGKINQKLIRKIKELYLELKQLLSYSLIKKTLAGSTFIATMLINNSVQAQSFNPGQRNAFNFPAADSVSYLGKACMVDIDADGDFDMITGGFAFDYNVFNFIPNVGTSTSPNFGTPVEYPFGIDTIPAVFTMPTTVDIDNDGDFDLMTGVFTFPNNTFGLFFNENTGTATNPNFSSSAINNPFNITLNADYTSYSVSPAFADIDNDGDQDLFVVDYYGDIRFFVNNGTAAAPNFGAEQVNPFGLSGTGYYLNYPTLSDFDGDGDKDLLIGKGYYESFEYYENTGTPSNPSFSAPVSNPFGLDQLSGDAFFISMPTNPVDIDGDGDKDLFSGIYNSTINYFENTSGIGAGIEESLPHFEFTVFPSPAKEEITLTVSGNLQEIDKIQLIDASGKIVYSSNLLIKTISVKEFETGFYILKISDKSGKSVQEKIQKI
jgi:hypothetical protein